MPASGTNLVDANVWLAIAVEGHVHHRIAREWFDTQSDLSCAFCRITQLALLRHLTNARIMGAAVLSQADAWKTYDALAGDPRVIFIEDPPSAESHFKALTQASTPAHERWSDAWLAAIAESGKLGIVTIDKGFRVPNNVALKLLGISPQ